MDTVELLHQLRLQTWDIKTQLWQQGFLTLHWWLIVIAIAASYVIWWKLADKRRVIELLLFGSFIAVSRVIFDDWGTSSGRWTYIIDLFPMGMSLFLNDLTVVPLGLMLVYQFSPDWKTFFVWLIVVQGSFSFGVLPLLSYLGILKIFAWEYYGTFVFMMITATVMRAIMLYGLKLERASRAVHPGGAAAFVAQPALKPLEAEEDEPEPR